MAEQGRAPRRKLLAPPRRFACLLAMLASTAAPVASSAQTLEIDLGRMSESLRLRYTIAETGEVPPEYILLGGLGFRPGFLESDIDLRADVVEYDDESGLIYRFRVPGQYRFVRREERREPFYYAAPRDVGIPDLEISIERVDYAIERLERKTRHEVWVEDVRYNLRRERAEKAGKGLLSLDIPIALPKSIERIIGKGEETNLSIQGSERIAIAGTSNWCSNCPSLEGRPQQEKFPDLDLEQNLNVSLRGTIGEKINVEIQHSSMGEGAASTNRVRLNYRGFDDEIIKLIEMGDTDLSLQGAQLVSYSGTAKGLFGVKTIAQAGPFDVTVIASKEEGESVSGSFSQSGGQTSRQEIRDIDFVKRQFFYLENAGPDFMNPRPGFFSHPSVNVFPVIGGASNDSLEVFMSLLPNEVVGGDMYRIDAYVDLMNDGLANDIGVDSLSLGGLTYKQLLRGIDFELIQSYAVSGETKYVGIELWTALPGDRNLVVRYRAADKDGNGYVIGDYGNFGAEPFTAELICADNTRFTQSKAKDPTWNLMYRNVYSFGGSGADGSAISVRIEDLENRETRDVHAPSRISYLRLFGLDRYDRTGAFRKDDLVDNRPGIIDPDRGLLMFPWLEPFNPPPQILAAILDPTDPIESAFDYATLARDTALYEKHLTGTEIDRNHKYKIVVEASSGRRNIQLAAYDIIEGSEVVTVNGSRLVRGADYDIDYMSGEVTIKTDIPPDSRIMIDYQHKPLIGGGKNSLVGFNANLNFSQKARLSGTFLYNSVGAPKYSPRVGEEPMRNMATDLNGSFIFNPALMTTLVNYLPRVDTNNQSSLNVSGEIAASFPDPNVKGEAIIEDMEGVEESNLVSMLRRSWWHASPPYDENETQRSVDDLPAEFYWYNAARTPQQEYFITSRRDLNPSLDPRENSTVTTLFLDAILDTTGTNEFGRWCGVMTAFPGGGLDLSTSQYVDIWVNDFDTIPGMRGGTVHIDFGRIDEDFYKPSPSSTVPDDEDKSPPPWTIEEDVGFDADDAGIGAYPSVLNESTWIPEKYVYGNKQTKRGTINARKGNQLRDTEDLNANGRLDRINAYYTTSFNLADSAIIDIRRDFPPDDPAGRWDDYWTEKNLNIRKAWRKYRLDISKVRTVFDEPPPEAIQFVRIWIEGVDTLTSFAQARLIEFADLQFVGSKWEYDGVRDLTGEFVPDTTVAQTGQQLIVGTINNKEDPARYRSPYLVTEEEGISNKEGSLTLTYRNFQPSTDVRVVKRFFGDGQNYNQYEDFQFFLYPDTLGGAVGFYLQLATDENNYYEIEVPLAAGDERDWHWVNIPFGALTNLKLDASNGTGEGEIKDSVDPTRVYTGRVKGNPSLFRVRFINAGLRNREGFPIDYGEVWFNDIRVGGVRRDYDHAERFNFSADFASILQLIGGWQRTGPDFRSLRQSRGEGYTTNSYFLNSKTEVNHFLPTARFTLPFTFNYLNSSSLPKYVPQSDIEIADRAVQDSLKNFSVNYGFTVSMARRGSTNFIMKNLFDNLRMSYGYSKKRSSTPATRDTVTTMSGSLGYQLQFRKNRELDVFGLTKWRWWLSQLTYESSIGTRYAQSYTFNAGELVRRPSGREGLWTNAFTTLYEPFESVKMNFQLSARRDLASEEEFLGLPYGVLTGWGHALSTQYQPVKHVFILSEFNPRFEYRSRYQEDSGPGKQQVRETRIDTLETPSGPQIVRISILDPEGTRDVSAVRDISLTLDVDLGKYFTMLGRALGVAEKGATGDPRQPRAGSVPRQPPTSEEFLRRLQEQNKPKPSEKAGKIEAPEEEEPAPPPGTGVQTPAAPPAGEPKPAGGAADLGIQRPRGVPGATGPEARPDSTGTPVGVGAADSLVAKADTTAKAPFDALRPLRRLFKLLGAIEPVKTNMTMNHTSLYNRLYERAGVAYQLGLSDAAGVAGLRGSDESEPFDVRDNFAVDFNSGMAITQDIGLDFKSRFSINESDRQGQRATGRQYTWPGITLSWRGMERKALLGKYFTRSDMSVIFERRTTEDQSGEGRQYSLAPSWNIEWKNRLSNTIGFAYKKNSAVRNKRETWDKTYGVNVSFTYDVEGKQGIGLPIPGLSSKKIAFKSTLRTNLGIAYGSTVSFNKPKGSSLGFTPNVSYRFSNSVSGSLGVNYSRNWGGQYGYVYQTLGVRVEGEFKF